VAASTKQTDLTVMVMPLLQPGLMKESVGPY